MSKEPTFDSADPREKLRIAYQDVQVARRYEEERDFRAQDVSLHYEAEIIALREALRDVKGPVLELAIGTGRLCRRLRDIGSLDKCYIGLDVSLQMLDEARKSLSNTSGGEFRRVYLLNADAFSTPFSNELFHAIIGFRFIKHMNPPNRGLLYKEAYRLLAKGGLLIFDFYGWRRRAETQEKGRRLTPQALRTELEENGFKLLKIYGTRHRLPALLSSPFRALKLKAPVKALGLLEIKLLSPVDELLGRSRGGIAVAERQ